MVRPGFYGGFPGVLPASSVSSGEGCQGKLHPPIRLEITISESKV
jgi:hypothetical protein